MQARACRYALAILCLCAWGLFAQSAGNPESASRHFELGRVHASRGEFAQADAEFKEAMRLSPGFLPARLASMQLLVTRGNFDQAIVEARDLLQYDPANLNAKLVLSAALMGKHDYRGAHAVLDPLPARAPRSADPWYQLGVLALAEDKPADAENAFRKVWAMDTSNTRGLLGILETYVKRNQAERAVALVQRELEAHPGRPDLLIIAGNTAVRAASYDVATGYFEQALKLKNGDPRAEGDILLRLGENYRRKGDLSAALPMLEKARERTPDNPIVLQTLAVTLDSLGRKPEAMEHYAALLKIDPENGIALNNLASALVESDGDLDFALQYAKAAVNLLPNLPETKDTLAEVYVKRGTTAEAIEILRDLTSQHPDRAIFHYHYGLALEQSGDKAAALSELKAAQSNQPSPAEVAKIGAAIERLNR